MAKICNQCGYKNNDRAIQCEHCGALLTKPEEKKVPFQLQRVPLRRGKNTHRRLMIVILCCAAIFIGAAVSGVILIRSNMTQKTYKEQITSAQKYLDEMDYEQAVTAFQMALEVNPDKEEPYIGLFQTYSEQNNMTLAISFLQKGCEQTGSQRLKIMLARYMSKTEAVVDSEDSAPLTEDDLQKLSEEVEINTAFIQKLKNYTYMDYKQNFGTSNTNRKESATLEVTCSDFSGKLYFQDTDHNKQVVDEGVWKPFDRAVPNYVVLDDLTSMFMGYAGGITTDRLEMMTGGKITQEYSKDAQSQIIRFTSGGCTIEVACDENGNVNGTTGIWNRIYPPAAGEVDQEKGHVIGVVVNATDGKGIDGVSLTAKPVSGGTQQNWKTGTDGAYEVDLEEGTYRVEAEKDGFMTEEYDLEVQIGEQTDAGTWTMSPELASGEIRIVLEWNASPRDLDSYLDGSTSDGTNIFINFRNEIVLKNGITYAELDTDETGGYGPETVTIHDAAGSYDYWVCDYRLTGSIGGCGATVKIYMPGQAVQTVEVASGAGNYWDVCHIENGEVTINNNITDSSDFTHHTG
ncbi:MAG: carboxypeptidase regulatory-like domain-containing protein [Lachnospiraceae bacterium]|nr:carboxypeptidase regulatory-like domain-containing protein [Lachnospiraceae bacterium]